MNEHGWTELLYSRIGLLIATLILITLTLKLTDISERLLKTVENDIEGEEIVRELRKIYFSPVETETYIDAENVVLGREHIEITAETGKLVYPLSFRIYNITAENLTGFHNILKDSFNHSGTYEDPFPEEIYGRLNLTPYYGELNNAKIGKAIIYFNSTEGIKRRDFVVIFR